VVSLGMPPKSLLDMFSDSEIFHVSPLSHACGNAPVGYNWKDVHGFHSHLLVVSTC
jgi:hypothetical protein